MDSPNRLRLAYIVDDGAAPREVELPFVIGVLANLSGASESERPPLADRHFEEVRRADLVRFLQARRPRVAFTVPDLLAGRGQLMVELEFESLDDFSAARVARGAETVRTVIAARGEDDPTVAAQIDLIRQHQSFQEVQAAWRGLTYLLEHTASTARVKVLVLDVSKSALYKSLRRYQGTSADTSPIFRKVYRDRYDTHGGEPFGCLIGDYYFDHTPPDLLVLRELSRMGAAAHCPFIAGVAPSLVHLEEWKQLMSGQAWPRFSTCRNTRRGDHCVKRATRGMSVLRCRELPRNGLCKRR